MNSDIFSVDHTGIEPASKKLQISLAMPWYILAHFNENVGNAEIESAATWSQIKPVTLSLFPIIRIKIFRDSGQNRTVMLGFADQSITPH